MMFLSRAKVSRGYFGDGDDQPIGSEIREQC